MGPVRAIKAGFKKSFVFSGRASRSEYWWFATFNFLLALGLGFFSGPAAIVRMAWALTILHPFSENIWFLAVFALIILYLAFAIPTVALGYRRFQDIGIRGSYYLWGFGLLAGFQQVGWLKFPYQYLVILSENPLLTPPSSEWTFVPMGLLSPGFIVFVLLNAALMCPSKLESNPYGPNPHGVAP